MLGFTVVPARSFLVNSMLAGAAGIALLGCSGGGSTSADDAAIGIQTSQLSVLIENKAGMALTDVDVAILPIGGSTQFTSFVGRMENAEKRDIALGTFLGRDGTTFSLRVIRPKTVRVTGKDLNAKAYNVQRSWQ